MPKRVVYTKITPLAANIPRQLALDMLHSHGEIIALNPLVTGHRPIDAPREATRDEYFAQWYEIEEIITWGFGMKKRIAFRGCFHDLPNGLQTHIYAPLGVDLRNKYIIAGNQPGEPKEVKELGLEAPAEGLYLREDVEITCNIALAGFVKKETKQTLETMIDRMTKKAELLDDGVLMAMFENGKLKTINPNQMSRAAEDRLRPTSFSDRSPSVAGSVPPSPAASQAEFTPGQTFTKYSQLPGRMKSTGAREPGVPIVPEMDGASNYTGGGQFYSTAVEMEGSSAYLTNDEMRARDPYAQAVNASSFTAELADTSTNPAAPSRLSGASYDADKRSVHGQHIIEQDRLATKHVGQQQQDQQQRRASLSMSNDQLSPLRTQPATGEHNPRRQSRQYHIMNPSASSPSSVDDVTDKLQKVTVYQPTGAPPTPGRVARCPMDKCDFQGTSEAVSQHVNRNHYA